MREDFPKIGNSASPQNGDYEAKGGFLGRLKADNRNVLTGYSESMRRLLEKGTYNPGPRPSEFVIGETSFLKNNSGAIPPNVLAVPLAETLAELSSQPFNVFTLANTSSSDSYQNYCRAAGVIPHPARMPSKLAEFFIDFLTDPKDLVIDPFAGSNVTGAAAERLGRRWKSIEIEQAYVQASRARFEQLQLPQKPADRVAPEAPTPLARSAGTGRSV
jgi:site-specific DNA-methyltransferase (cytosine-N4-specific)